MAKAFKFRLETVERVRRQIRDAQRRVVADAAKAVRDVEERIERTNASIRDQMSLLRGEQQQSEIDMAAVCGHRFYMTRLHRELHDAYGMLEEKKQVFAQEQTKLAEVAKELKVIEKLREKQHKRFMERIERAERAMDDEAALQLYMRNDGHFAEVGGS